MSACLCSVNGLILNRRGVFKSVKALMRFLNLKTFNFVKTKVLDFLKTKIGFLMINSGSGFGEGWK